MDNIAKNIALGAAAVGAGAIVVGATMLGNNPQILSSPNGSNNGGGGTTVSVTVAELHPSVSISSPVADDVFLTRNSINLSTTFKDDMRVGLTLIDPNGNTCDLGTHEATSGDWTSDEGAVYSGSFSLATCNTSSYGEYTLKAYTPGFSTSDSRYAETTNKFYYDKFSVLYSTFDNNADPIIFIHYGEGIGLVELSARRVGETTDILDGWKYPVENNENYADEVVLPFKDKGAKVGSYVLTATAYKADGSPINSQGADGATITANLEYNGISKKEENE